jgi:hypothetical protein
MTSEVDPFGGTEPPAQLPSRKAIDVKGRREHESFLFDEEKCAQHGLDVVYERMVYLRRWGSYLTDDE